MSKSKTKKLWLIAAITVLVFAGIITFNYQDWIKAYYQNFTTNHYHYGDPVEIGDQYRSIAESNGIDLFHIVKSGDTYDVVLVKSIPGKKIQQKNIKVIGTYVGYKILPLPGRGNKLFVSLVYAIKPNEQLTESYPTTALSLKPIDNNYYTIQLPLLK